MLQWVILLLCGVYFARSELVLSGIAYDIVLPLSNICQKPNGPVFEISTIDKTQCAAAFIEVQLTESSADPIATIFSLFSIFNGDNSGNRIDVFLGNDKLCAKIPPSWTDFVDRFSSAQISGNSLCFDLNGLTFTRNYYSVGLHVCGINNGTQVGLSLAEVPGPKIFTREFFSANSYWSSDEPNFAWIATCLENVTNIGTDANLDNFAFYSVPEFNPDLFYTHMISPITMREENLVLAAFFNDVTSPNQTNVQLTPGPSVSQIIGARSSIVMKSESGVSNYAVKATEVAMKKRGLSSTSMNQVLTNPEQCNIWGDPHVQCFNGGQDFTFGENREVGTYLVAKSPTTGIEIYLETIGQQPWTTSTTGHVYLIKRNPITQKITDNFAVFLPGVGYDNLPDYTLYDTMNASSPIRIGPISSAGSYVSTGTTQVWNPNVPADVKVFGKSTSFIYYWDYRSNQNCFLRFDIYTTMEQNVTVVTSTDPLITVTKPQYISVNVFSLIVQSSDPLYFGVDVFFRGNYFPQNDRTFGLCGCKPANTVKVTPCVYGNWSNCPAPCINNANSPLVQIQYKIAGSASCAAFNTRPCPGVSRCPCVYNESGYGACSKPCNTGFKQTLRLALSEDNPALCPPIQNVVCNTQECPCSYSNTTNDVCPSCYNPSSGKPVRRYQLLTGSGASCATIKNVPCDIPACAGCEILASPCTPVCGPTSAITYSYKSTVNCIQNPLPPPQTCAISCDKDECQDASIQPLCSINGKCTNVICGSTSCFYNRTYSCSCNSGFSGNGITCTDIDECSSSSLNNCASRPNQICINTLGSYYCACDSARGYFNDSTRCAPACNFGNWTTDCDAPCGESGYLYRYVNPIVANDPECQPHNETCTSPECPPILPVTCNLTDRGSEFEMAAIEACSCIDPFYEFGLNAHCLYDVCSGDDVTIAGEHCANARRICLTKSVARRRVSSCPSACPNQCSGTGKCDSVTSTCTCNAGWTGADCSLPVQYTCATANYGNVSRTISPLLLPAGYTSTSISSYFPINAHEISQSILVYIVESTPPSSTTIIPISNTFIFVVNGKSSQDELGGAYTLSISGIPATVTPFNDGSDGNPFTISSTGTILNPKWNPRTTPKSGYVFANLPSAYCAKFTFTNLNPNIKQIILGSGVGTNKNNKFQVSRIKVDPSGTTSVTLCASNCSDTCQQYTNCTTCTQDAKCGWCRSTSVCSAGTPSGPSRGQCLNWRYDFDPKTNRRLRMSLGYPVLASSVEVYLTSQNGGNELPITVGVDIPAPKIQSYDTVVLVPVGQSDGTYISSIAANFPQFVNSLRTFQQTNLAIVSYDTNGVINVLLALRSVFQPISVFQSAVQSLITNGQSQPTSYDYTKILASLSSQSLDVNYRPFAPRAVFVFANTPNSKSTDFPASWNTLLEGQFFPVFIATTSVLPGISNFIQNDLQFGATYVYDSAGIASSTLGFTGSKAITLAASTVSMLVTQNGHVDVFPDTSISGLSVGMQAAFTYAFVKQRPTENDITSLFAPGFGSAVIDRVPTDIPTCYNYTTYFTTENEPKLIIRLAGDTYDSSYCRKILAADPFAVCDFGLYHYVVTTLPTNGKLYQYSSVSPNFVGTEVTTGTVLNNCDGKVIFSPDPHASSLDYNIPMTSIGFRVFDDCTLSEECFIPIVVQPVQDPPFVPDIYVTITEDSNTTINVSENLFDWDRVLPHPGVLQSHAYQLVGTSGICFHGESRLIPCPADTILRQDSPSGNPLEFFLNYSVGPPDPRQNVGILPGPNVAGFFEAVLVFRDHYRTAPETKIHVTVTPVNDPPTISTETSTFIFDEDKGGLITVVLEDIDSDNFTLTVQPPTTGQLYDVTNSKIVDANYTFTFTNGPGKTSITFKYTPPQYAASVCPVQFPQTTLEISDCTPFDSISFSVSDPENATAETGNINVIVTPVNNPPVATGTASLMTDEDTPIVIFLNISDIDSYEWQLSSLITALPNHCRLYQYPYPGVVVQLSLSENNVTDSQKRVVLTCDPHWNGQTVFTYQAFDSYVYSQSTRDITVTVNPVNNPPYGSVAPTYVFDQETSGSIQVNAGDIDSALFRIKVHLPPGFSGTLRFDPDGSTTNGLVVSNEDTFDINQVVTGPATGGSANRYFRYTNPPLGASDCVVAFPRNTNERATCLTYTTVTFEVIDSDGLSSGNFTTEIVVIPIDQPPVATLTDVSFSEEETANITLTVTDVDSPQENITCSFTTFPGLFTISEVRQFDGTVFTTSSDPVSDSQKRVVFVGAKDFSGITYFGYSCYDGFLHSNIQNVTVNVTRVNDIPFITAPTNFTFAQDEGGSVFVISGDIDSPEYFVTVVLGPEFLGELVDALNTSVTNNSQFTLTGVPPSEFISNFFYFPLPGEKSNCTEGIPIGEYHQPTNPSEVQSCQPYTKISFFVTDTDYLESSPIIDVPIIVLPQNAPPIPTCPDVVYGFEDENLVVNLTVSDSDSFQSQITVFIDSTNVGFRPYKIYQYPYDSNPILIAPESSLEVTDAESPEYLRRVVFVFDRDYFGNTSFTYTISDGVYTASKSVIIDVARVNDAPEIQTSPTSYTLKEDNTYLFYVNYEDRDSPNFHLVVDLPTDFKGTLTPFDQFTTPPAINDGDSFAQGGPGTATSYFLYRPLQYQASTCCTTNQCSGPMNSPSWSNETDIATCAPLTSVSFYVIDEFNATSSVYSVDLIVFPINNPPVPSSPQFYHGYEDTNLTVYLNVTDVDSPNEWLISAVTIPPPVPFALFNGDNSVSENEWVFTEPWTLTVQPGPENWNGNVTLTYGVFDGISYGETRTISLYFEPVNDAPTITAGNKYVYYNAEFSNSPLSIVAGDIDSASFNVTVTLPSNFIGSLTDSGGSEISSGYVFIESGTGIHIPITYTPPFNTFSSCTPRFPKFPENDPTQVCTPLTKLTITSVDIEGLASIPASIEIDIIVAPIDNEPVPTSPSPLITNEDTPFLVNLSASDIDSPASDLFAYFVSFPAHFTVYDLNGSEVTSLTPIPANSLVRFVPDLDYFNSPPAHSPGPSSFAYKVYDQFKWSSVKQVDVVVELVNDAPILQSLTVETQEENFVEFPLSASDIDSFGTNLTFKVTQLPDPANGILQLPDGTSVSVGSDIPITFAENGKWEAQIKFVPTGYFYGNITFGISVSDVDNGNSVPKQTNIVNSDFKVIVTPVNHVPSAYLNNPNIKIYEDICNVIELAYEDIENDPVQFLLTPNTAGTYFQLPSSGLVNSDCISQNLVQIPIVLGTPVTLTGKGFVFVSEQDKNSDAVKFNQNPNLYSKLEFQFQAVEVAPQTQGQPTTVSTIVFISVEISPVNDAPIFFGDSVGVHSSVQFDTQNIQSSWCLSSCSILEDCGIKYPESKQPAWTPVYLGGGDVEWSDLTVVIMTITAQQPTKFYELSYSPPQISGQKRNFVSTTTNGANVNSVLYNQQKPTEVVEIDPTKLPLELSTTVHTMLYGKVAPLIGVQPAEDGNNYWAHITYKLVDQHGAETSSYKTIDIFVTPVNDAPRATATGSLQVFEGIPRNFAPAATDIENDPFSVKIIGCNDRYEGIQVGKFQYKGTDIDCEAENNVINITGLSSDLSRDWSITFTAFSPAQSLAAPTITFEFDDQKPNGISTSVTTISILRINTYPLINVTVASLNDTVFVGRDTKYSISDGSAIFSLWKSISVSDNEATEFGIFVTSKPGSCFSLTHSSNVQIFVSSTCSSPVGTSLIGYYSDFHAVGSVNDINAALNSLSVQILGDITESGIDISVSDLSASGQCPQSIDSFDPDSCELYATLNVTISRIVSTTVDITVTAISAGLVGAAIIFAIVFGIVGFTRMSKQASMSTYTPWLAVDEKSSMPNESPLESGIGGEECNNDPNADKEESVDAEDDDES